LVEQWNGNRWSIKNAPSTPHESFSELLGVSCPGTSFCFAVGIWQDRSGIQYPLLERWNGTTWSMQPTAEPYGKNDTVNLSAVSCSSPTACTVVGTADVPVSGGYSFWYPAAERWDGHSWHIQEPVPDPSIDSDDQGFDGVSCVASRVCAAVGNNAVPMGSGAPLDFPFSETWNRERWGGLASSHYNSTLDGVSCASDRTCVAVPRGPSHGTATGTVTHGHWHVSVILPGVNLDPVPPSYQIVVRYSGDSSHGPATAERRIRIESEPVGL
jgi:hypothetical protein